MKRDDNVYLGHMFDLARKAVAKAEGSNRESYDAGEDIRMVLSHLVQMIGEAANRVSVGGRIAHPEIPWKQIIGVRRRIVRDYMDVDYDVIWAIVNQDLPPLVRMLTAILGEEGAKEQG